MTKASRNVLYTAAAMPLMMAALAGAAGHPGNAGKFPVDMLPSDGLPAASVQDTTEVGWRILAELNYRTGEKTDTLAALEGKLVKIPGFTVPLEDWASSATEFLLVPYVGACIHTPPPPPNQLVYIEMDEGKRAKMDGWNPVWVEGVLTIEMTQSVYGDVGYTITGHRVYPYEF
ncbi:MAG: DUF3299 domain-containing protein [Gemmatimonadota bacterium]|nr:DUF3299 domain-containing protein [Gemmatimonadota bacterium]